jgi:hypothetical protein
MIKKIALIFFAGALVLATGCKTKDVKMNSEKKATTTEHKKVVYQVFTRLFGNTNTTNKPWGTIEENGVKQNKKLKFEINTETLVST